MHFAFKLILSIAIPLLTGFLSGFFTATGVRGWYKTITLPSWNPPNWVFGPVWTLLYVLMGISFYLVWRSDSGPPLKRTAILLFAVQLVLNFFWSVIFFGRHQIGWAFAEILLLWMVIIATIFSFSKISHAAAWLLVPYISWVSFAAILNFTIWKLNS